MRLVTPISRSDLNRLPEWIEVIKFQRGCGQQHGLHFVVPRSIASVAFDAQTELSQEFQSVEVHEIDVEPTAGWPFAPNIFFWHAARIMAETKGGRMIPFQLVELDCLPTHQNAFDAISSRYVSCGMPFFGNVGVAPWHNTDPASPAYGKIVPSLWGEGDIMMSGCGVYPGDLIIRPNCAPLMADFVKGQDSAGVAWDMHLRTAMKADGMAHTDLIANHWNTGNYRVEGGVLVCDDLPDHEVFQRDPHMERRKNDGPVNPSAVLVHGCKDESLAKLILSGKIPDAVFVASTARTVSTAKGSAPKPLQPEPESPRIAVLEKKVDTLTTSLERLIQLQTAALEQNGVVHQTVGSPVIAKSEPDKLSPQGIWPVIRANLQLKKWQLGKLAKEVSLPEDQLKELLESKGYEIGHPLPWIKAPQDDSKVLATA